MYPPSEELVWFVFEREIYASRELVSPSRLISRKGEGKGKGRETLDWMEEEKPAAVEEEPVEPGLVLPLLLNLFFFFFMLARACRCSIRSRRCCACHVVLWILERRHRCSSLHPLRFQKLLSLWLLLLLLIPLVDYCPPLAFPSLDLQCSPNESDGESMLTPMRSAWVTQWIHSRKSPWYAE